MLDSYLVNITNLMLMNVQDFILTKSKLLLLSSQPGMWTSSSLCVSCICQGSWSAGPIHVWPLELWHTTSKWLCLTHMLHVLPNARHCLCMCDALQYLQFSVLHFLLLFRLLFVSYLGFLALCIWSKSFMLFMSLTLFFLCSLLFHS